jgi:lipopolysaccharide export system protein LptC
MRHISRKWRDWLSAWLPVLCMGFFALGTFWLVRSAPVVLVAPPAAPPGHDPDYFMRQFAVRQFDAQGRMTSELFGTEGQHHPDIDKLVVQAPRWRAYDAQGRLITGHSERAVSNRDGSEVELFGDARVVRAPLPPATPAGKAPADSPLIFSGQYLRAWTRDHRVSSDQPVQLARGSDVFTGDRLDYDDRTGIANLQGRVHGVIQPRR